MTIDTWARNIVIKKIDFIKLDFNFKLDYKNLIFGA